MSMNPIVSLPIKNTDDQPTERLFFVGSVPLPPSVNASYQVIKVKVLDKKTGRHVIKHRIGPTPDLEAFKLQADSWLKRHAPVDKEVLETIQHANEHTPLDCVIRGYFVTMWKRDLDGIIKASVDALFAHIGLDDRLVVHYDVTKLVDRDNPRVEIELRLLAR